MAYEHRNAPLVHAAGLAGWPADGADRGDLLADLKESMADLLKTIMDADHGGSASEANRKFAEMLSAVYATRKKGTLKFTLEVSPSKFSKHDGSVTGVEVRINVDTKKPEFDNPSSMFFVMPDGSLSRRHPDQIEMEMEYAEDMRNG